MGFCVEGAGKTAVTSELQRRGFYVVHGDRELAYRGDPVTGRPVVASEAQGLDPVFVHAHHLWDIKKVKVIAADRSREVTFFCGGSRNLAQFIGLFDRMFVLELDAGTLRRRLAGRGGDEFGGRPDELVLVLSLHASRAEIPDGAFSIDATVTLEAVVDEIVAEIGVQS